MRNMSTIKKVDTFDLSNKDSKQKYEDLLNSEDVSSIDRDEFTYDKIGRAKVTIWYSVYND